MGGVEDHLHLLISLPPTLSLGEAMKRLKSNTSKWIRETFGLQKFSWQEGYGAFSYGHSQLDKIITYIRNQERHHARRSFKD